MRLRQIAGIFGIIELPIWLVVIAAVFAVIAALERALIPSTRWFFRRWMEWVVAKVRARCDRLVEPLKLAKRRDML